MNSYRSRLLAVCLVGSCALWGVGQVCPVLIHILLYTIATMLVIMVVGAWTLCVMWAGHVIWHWVKCGCLSARPPDYFTPCKKCKKYKDFGSIKG